MWTSKKDGQVAQILEVPIFGSSEDRLLKLVAGWIDTEKGEKGPRLIFTPNAEILVEANKDLRFKEVLKRADINIPDGVGVVLAARLLHQNVSARITGTDFSHKLVMMASKEGYRVYMLGGRPSVASKAAELLKIEANEAGWEVNPKFEIESDPGVERVGDMGIEDNRKMVERINAFRPDILLVAFGHKKQEGWLMANKGLLKAKVAVGVGGAFDFWSGRVRRAPVYLRVLGLEWLYRLVQEPWRWRRQLKLIEFSWQVVKSAFRG